MCADCGNPGTITNEATLARGSAIREPGEMLCPSCTSRRNLMVRQLDRLPDNLPSIRALRSVSLLGVA